MHVQIPPKTARTGGPPRLFWIALVTAVGLFTFALSLWAIYGIISQRLWIPLGWRRGLTLTDMAATLGGAAILCGAVAYVSYAGLRVLDGWEITADRITWYGCVGGLVLAIAAFVVNAL